MVMYQWARIRFYLHRSVQHTFWCRCSKAQTDSRRSKLSPWTSQGAYFVWVLDPKQGNSETEWRLFFGDKFTCGWCLLKDYYHSVKSEGHVGTLWLKSQEAERAVRVQWAHRSGSQTSSLLFAHLSLFWKGCAIMKHVSFSTTGLK